MNRRLRKKKKLGEFDFKGFEVTCKFSPPLKNVDTFMESFIEFIESRHLQCGGMFSENSLGQYLTRVAPRLRKVKGNLYFKEVDCTEEDRAAVGRWLRANGAASIDVWGLTSLTRGPFSGPKQYDKFIERNSNES